MDEKAVERQTKTDQKWLRRRKRKVLKSIVRDKQTVVYLQYRKR